jgi:hypothetical protein
MLFVIAFFAVLGSPIPGRVTDPSGAAQVVRTVTGITPGRYTDPEPMAGGVEALTPGIQQITVPAHKAGAVVTDGHRLCIGKTRISVDAHAA